MSSFVEVLVANEVVDSALLELKHIKGHCSFSIKVPDDDQLTLHKRKNRDLRYWLPSIKMIILNEYYVPQWEKESSDGSLEGEEPPQPLKARGCFKRVWKELLVLPVIDIHGDLGVSTLARAEAAAAVARGWWWCDEVGSSEASAAEAAACCW